MQSLTLRTHVGKDGVLKLETPVGVKNTDLEIILVVNPIEAGKPVSEWPVGFFTEVIGGWKGTPFVRESQGTYEARSQIK
ncbi:MAG: hypothetical protein ABSF99_08255 [Anaerolineales bacterium]|jgi:hypothetical protein